MSRSLRFREINCFGQFIIGEIGIAREGKSKAGFKLRFREFDLLTVIHYGLIVIFHFVLKNLTIFKDFSPVILYGGRSHLF